MIRIFRNLRDRIACWRGEHETPKKWFCIEEDGAGITGIGDCPRCGRTVWQFLGNLWDLPGFPRPHWMRG
jgi:hypothetical protein